jgi:hypothetical protein
MIQPIEKNIIPIYIVFILTLASMVTIGQGNFEKKIFRQAMDFN